MDGKQLTRRISKNWRAEQMTENKRKMNISKLICAFLLVSGILFACGNPNTLPTRSDPAPEKDRGNQEISAELNKILLINSNAAVEKYRVVQEEFKKTVPNPIKEVDLGSKKEMNADIAGMSSYNPDIIYCIGGKAYSLANKHFSDKPIVFSSIINWLRLPRLPRKLYGVSNELHPRMPIFMFRSVFQGIEKIGMLYSPQYTSEWFENTKSQAKELGLEIIGRAVSDKTQTLLILKQLLPDVDAMWIISDPLVMGEKKYLYEILKICDINKTPVFSYHHIFAKLGAVLIVSVDDPTIGRQTANIAMGVLSGDEIDEKVQFPAGSHVVLNLKKVNDYGLEYNKNALGLINDIIK